MMFFAITSAGTLATNEFGKVAVWNDGGKPAEGAIFSQLTWPLCTCGHIAENHNTPCEDPSNYKCDGYEAKCHCTGYEPSHRWQKQTLLNLAGRRD